VHPHVRVYFVIIKDVFIFHCRSLEMNVFACPVFTFTTLLSTKPMTYGKFIKDCKWLLKQLVLGKAIVVTLLGEEGQVFASDWHSR